VIETMSEFWFEDEQTMRNGLDSEDGRALIYFDPLLMPMAISQIDEITTC